MLNGIVMPAPGGRWRVATQFCQKNTRRNSAEALWCTMPATMKRNAAQCKHIARTCTVLAMVTSTVKYKTRRGRAMAVRHIRRMKCE